MKPVNNIGFLRLLFASCVIIGHAPELADGNRSREPLTCIFHTLSLGELSVDAFFLLSGYLIAASMVNSHSATTYFRRRIVRIYPGYLAAFAIVIFALGPCLGIKIEPALEIIFRTVLLLPPANSPQLAPLHYPNLDVVMWTISYEFRCYIFLALFNKFGLFHKRLMAVVVISLAATSFAATFNSIHEDLHRFGQNGLVWLILEDPAA
ncbi:MAG: acyltransferase, partial [Acidocella sp.]|nr:acyltransferase [Acidocella sp.]